ncbi:MULTISPECIES: Rha family transcriptional regulator [Pseudomonas syringae group]|uniref:Phage regulatory protein n=3 Tax=root TaxID=1 RepID=A0AAW4DSZ2_PSESX|nr:MULTISPECIES: phage regulatory protein [Pseudomonas syringae group]MBI6711610.1 phage regulatory protein [Pseudomonas syringae]MBI6735943.1 phage regulatory protein [Pseudomonas syringae]MBM1212480.1 phage regulatory protein [Pseudomonas syringae]MBM1218241.1 phage regulatory protein [Pseudomonas syringae]MBX6401976.1 phage regulatory protein [Pseudomonas syringae pv. tomato]
MTNNTTVVDMRKFVEARDGKAFTTTHQVALAFGKLHNHVLAKVRALECSDQFLTDNFSSVQFEHRGNTYEAFEITKDGFMFLVMGFTGKAAAAIKEGYIAAFNEMARRLNVSSTDLVGDLVGSVIGTSGEHVLDRVIDQKASPVAKGLQRSFRHTMKSRLRSRFNVQRTALIPAECMADACNFVAAYVLEGEFLPKEIAVDFKGSPHSRYLLSLDEQGRQRVELLTHDTMVMNARQFIKAMSTSGDAMISTEQLLEFMAVAVENLRQSAEIQSARAAA